MIRKKYIITNKLKMRIPKMMNNILHPPNKEITNHKQTNFSKPMMITTTTLEMACNQNLIMGHLQTTLESFGYGKIGLKRLNSRMKNVEPIKITRRIKRSFCSLKR